MRHTIYVDSLEKFYDLLAFSGQVEIRIDLRLPDAQTFQHHFFQKMDVSNFPLPEVSMVSSKPSIAEMPSIPPMEVYRRFKIFDLRTQTDLFVWIRIQ